MTAIALQPPRRTSFAPRPIAMHVRRFSTLEEIAPYADDWELLAADVPFRGWTWLSNWWRITARNPGATRGGAAWPFWEHSTKRASCEALLPGISTTRRSTAGRSAHWDPAKSVPNT